MESGRDPVKQEPDLRQLAVSIHAPEVKQEAGVPTLTTSHPSCAPSTRVQNRAKGTALDIYHRNLQAENDTLRNRERSLTIKLDRQNLVHEAQLASLSQSLREQDTEHKREMERERELFDARIAALSQSLIEQAQETDRQRDVYESRIASLRETVSGKDRQIEREREVDESRIASLSQSLSECQTQSQSLSHSLTESRDIGRRMARELLQRRMADRNREERDQLLQAQMQEQREEIARLQVELVRHESLRPPQRKRAADPLTGLAPEIAGGNTDTGAVRDVPSNHGGRGDGAASHTVCGSRDAESVGDQRADISACKAAGVTSGVTKSSESGKPQSGSESEGREESERGGDEAMDGEKEESYPDGVVRPTSGARNVPRPTQRMAIHHSTATGYLDQQAESGS
ncbi:hypothetical protein KIPB_010019 [Kipferlia bialata]|uniref:Uncharacterized protein n=1 Tax=Kipferlia bialata TaxID=797122 RepID=A0A9K3GL92_9EUKA|nr:hypothetical protein KIPB_010019 [Kipferlia bialata]|eukprot:g10019.t1